MDWMHSIVLNNSMISNVHARVYNTVLKLILNYTISITYMNKLNGVFKEYISPASPNDIVSGNTCFMISWMHEVNKPMLLTFRFSKIFANFMMSQILRILGILKIPWDMLCRYLKFTYTLNWRSIYLNPVQKYGEK